MFLSLICFFFAFITPVVVCVDPVPIRWSNSWAVEIRGGCDKADEIAAKYDFINLGPIGSLKDMYHFAKHDGDVSVGTLVKELVNGPHNYIAVGLENDPEVIHSEQQTLVQWKKKYLQPETGSDPIWGDQWTVNNTGQTGERTLLVDLNVEPAWIQGYTGNNIIVGVVDDGVEIQHNDLSDNYDSSNSYDYYDFDSNPNPANGDSHGTACAGEIGMVRSNGVCGVGVAYDSKIAGLRLIVGPTTDAQDASGLSHNRQNIDIYSNSWGPFDDGATVGGPRTMTIRALMEGSTEGRNNLGNIFTWAAGNGGGYYDSCSADGYVQSIYTIPVGAYSQNGGPADYDEKCSAKMTVAYVDNTLDPDLQVATLARNDECTLTFDGTSSAAPYVSAVIALTLEANPRLTWRDIQYLIAYTSNSNPLVIRTDDEFTNGAGLTVSHQFGFGAIDTEAMVTRAQRWVNVPAQLSDTVIPSVTSGTATYGSPLEITFTYSENIVYMEHIVVTMSLNASGYTKDIDQYEAFYTLYYDYYLYYDSFEDDIKRGDLQATITSPSNTVSTLLFKRPFDIVTTEGYLDWPFLSVLHWGENPNGEWTIRLYWTNSNGGSGILSDVSVTIYGVSTMPQSVANIPPQCDSSCARGCSGVGSQHCDACTSTLLRNATTLECIQLNECVSPNEVASGYCYLPSGASEMFTKSAVLVFIAFIVSLCLQ